MKRSAIYAASDFRWSSISAAFAIFNVLSMPYRKSEEEMSGETLVPSYTIELGKRIEAIVSRYQFKKDAADICGVGVDQLNRYMKGTSAAPFEVLARLALDRGVSLNWLATGAEPMMLADIGTGAPAPVEPGLLGLICEQVSKAYEEADKAVSVEQIGIVAGQIYNELPAPSVGTPERLIEVGRAMERLRAELRGAPVPDTLSGKRRA